MKNLTTKVLFISLLLSLIFNGTSVLAGASIYDQASGGLGTAIDEAYGGGNDVDVNQTTFSQGLIKIINNLLTFAGIVFFLLLVYAGYLWMTARGREEQIERAKKITREVVIGLIIIVLARIITEFILTQIGTATNVPDSAE